MNLSFIRISKIFAASIFLIVAMDSMTVAKERQTSAVGFKQCSSWCTDHNTFGSDKWKSCVKRCDVYWSKNGSDTRAQ